MFGVLKCSVVSSVVFIETLIMSSLHISDSLIEYSEIFLQGVFKALVMTLNGEYRVNIGLPFVFGVQLIVFKACCSLEFSSRNFSLLICSSVYFLQSFSSSFCSTSIVFVLISSSDINKSISVITVSVSSLTFVLFWLFSRFNLMRYCFTLLSTWE